ncbi:epimerase family protein SDR39U1-like [Gigantopelta aegis]|uniref:epimerase family protein SDR39U1-like n=1 Tax=Gigantopelta aegis TaxID=1735272 RepID=UPI001B88D752|nr:epimerase family protein SDR39U1-like [Gigantopelta aegis]
MSVLIGGGSGFIGRHLGLLLLENGFKVTVVSRESGPNKITWTDLKQNGLPDDCTAVVSLAGENILNPRKRWNESFKEIVRSSRIDTTKTLAAAIVNSSKPPKVFVSMSGVAYYKPSTTEEYDEDSPGGNYDFLSRLTVDWEKAAKLPASSNVRQVTIRSGVVLGRDGGMIQQIYLPFFLGLGGRIGSGSQWFPWIHVADIGGIFTHAIINDNISGILNGVAPQAATNLEFTKSLGSEMWRPTIFPIPGFVINYLLGEERGKVILEGQKVIPKRTLESGYKFVFPDLISACQNCAHMF